jgi:hypothetical protein
MITNIDIDEDLVAEAMKVSGARTKREVVDKALRELVARSKRTRLRDVWGMLEEGDMWPGYDPKTEPGETPGQYRVEEPLAGYKLPPRPALPQAKPKAKRARK